ncbi:MAG: DUF427 domain-containing protein [Alphaproteobacteria bacterium]
MSKFAVTNIEARKAIYRGYRFDIEPSPRPVRVEFNGVTIAESDRVVVLRETRLAPVYYFPRDDVRMDLLQRTELHTHCPFKGNASYWTVKVGDREAENAVWSYEDPFEEAASIKDYVAIYWQKMDGWYQDGLRMARQEPPASTIGNPFVDWLMRKAPHVKTAEELVRGFAEMLVGAGQPVWRVRCMIRTLHPEVLASVYTWQDDWNEISVHHPTYEVLDKEAFQSSPFALIMRGEGGIRRRLTGASPVLDFPVLEELRERGATDYVAIPLKFSDGQLNIITLVSKAPDGFTTEHLGELYEILPMLARVMEVHALHRTAASLLGTYLGHNTGQRVLNGRIKRGDGEDVHAVIWFSDLRESTRLSETLPRATYLALLDGFFDAMAGAVMDHGGEVLKFIGDSVLAIFPIKDRTSKHPDAPAKAIAAARDAERRMAKLNQDRQAMGESPLGYGIALHRGDLTYGNIGASGRLDFTVIGPAVNQASRIQDMCKALQAPILLSAAFANSFAGDLPSFGEHQLRGIEARQELFTLPPDSSIVTAAE